MTVYWYCPKPPEVDGVIPPSGGVWLIHRLGQMLAQLGVPSRVVVPEPFKVWWDAHPIDPSVLLQTDSTTFLAPNDTMILPEVMWPAKFVNPEVRSVMFLQNYIWLDDAKRQLARETKPEILVCSRHLYSWCMRELGITPIGIVNPFLDDDVWDVEGKESNRTLIFARRNPEMALRLADALIANNIPVDMVSQPVSQRDIREHLNHAEYYLHHVEPEGFPMAALEAMRCGTIPVGTTGGGGNEFMFNDETALVTPGPLMGHYDDPQIFVDQVVKLFERLRGSADLRSKLWQQGHSWSLRYSPQETNKQLRKVFGA